LVFEKPSHLTENWKRHKWKYATLIALTLTGIAINLGYAGYKSRQAHLQQQQALEEYNNRLFGSANDPEMFGLRHLSSSEQLAKTKEWLVENLTTILDVRYKLYTLPATQRATVVDLLTNDLMREDIYALSDHHYADKRPRRVQYADDFVREHREFFIRQ
jgi:hypothetical protein